MELEKLLCSVHDRLTEIVGLQQSWNKAEAHVKT